MGAHTDFQTPDWICEIMADLIPSNVKSILEPTPGKGNLVAAIKKRFPNSIVYSPEHFEDFDKHRVGCIVANPPFTPMKAAYLWLDTFFKMSDYIVIIMPWMSLINSEARTKNYIEHGLKLIVSLPRRAFKGARVQTCILVFQKGYHGDIIFKNVVR